MSNDNRTVLTVSMLNQRVASLLEDYFPSIWVEGEISSLTKPGSGHLYFSLKDEKAQIRCALFRNRARLLNFNVENGTHVLMRASVSLYQARGDYQLIVEHLEETGDGRLRREFERLKLQLAEEGLFASERKKPLPSLPKQIGIVSSPTGAALHDILSVLRRRFASIPIIIYPASVQGASAVQDIINSLNNAAQRNECDVLILARGGGSMEDLWSFNDERLARAIWQCPIPVVTGVGHEIDFTIADFVADVRAPTPSAAAEIVSPNRAELQENVDASAARLLYVMTQIIQSRAQTLDWLTQRLPHPLQNIQRSVDHLEQLQLRLRHSTQPQLQHHQLRLHHLNARLQECSPQQKLQSFSHRLTRLHELFVNRISMVREIKRGQLSTLSRALEAISPLSTLNRGYAIVKSSDSNNIIRNSSDTHLKQELDILLSKGQIRCRVEKIQPGNSGNGKKKR